ncbi:unnamed protein product [Acanthoscelides obtectus]|uniref:Uncharacterized protein n=1 Tax=Acanthoscelides obtectus TaxID=200917 RepID=A0A9P0K4U1_ACAOB|nr:unnamed protein product [Acanthoscelides obtectus]CAK1653196.1 Odorant receptor 94b [Acanthoscelides obtectus]
MKKSGDLVRKYYYCSSVFVIIAHPLVNLTRPEKEPLYTGYTPPQIGVVGLLTFQAVMTIYLVFLCSTYVSLDANLLIEIGIQIEILKDVLENSEDIDIFECVQRYAEIQRLHDKVQRIFRVGISVNFLTGVLIFCTTLFRILEVVVSELMFMLPYSFAIILIIYIHCWFGNELIYRSNGITQAIFKSKWIGRDRSIQKNLIIFMMFTKKPIHIDLAGGLLTMAIPVFMSICRTAYSYFTILQKFR